MVTVLIVVAIVFVVYLFAIKGRTNNPELEKFTKYGDIEKLKHSGAMVCMEQRAFSSTMGTGQMVFGLAPVIIGTTLFRKMSFVKGTTAVLVGSVFYNACIQVAISLGLPANLMKLATAVLFLAVLVLGNRQKGGAENA